MSSSPTNSNVPSEIVSIQSTTTTVVRPNDPLRRVSYCYVVGMQLLFSFACFICLIASIRDDSITKTWHSIPLLLLWLATVETFSSALLATFYIQKHDYLPRYPIKPEAEAAPWILGVLSVCSGALWSAAAIMTARWRQGAQRNEVSKKVFSSNGSGWYYDTKDSIVITCVLISFILIVLSLYDIWVLIAYSGDLVKNVYAKGFVAATTQGSATQTTSDNNNNNQQTLPTQPSRAVIQQQGIELRPFNRRVDRYLKRQARLASSQQTLVNNAQPDPDSSEARHT